MNDASVAMTTFAGQVELGIGVPGKVNAGADEPFNAFLAVLHSETHGFFAAQASASSEGILHMVFGGVLVVQNSCYAALGPECGSAADVTLADHAYL